MASPITSSDFEAPANLVDVCAKLTFLLSSNEKVAALVDYLFDGSGEPRQPLLALGLQPPGTVHHYWTNTSDWTTAKAEVEKLQRTQDDIDSGAGPFWRICDGLDGTPNLKGRFILGASGSADITAGLSARTINSIGGEENHSLTEGEMPPHFHDITIHKGSETGNGPHIYSTDESEVQMTDYPTAEAGGADGAVEPHNNMPPFYCLYPIIRTSRLY